MFTAFGENSQPRLKVTIEPEPEPEPESDSGVVDLWERCGSSGRFSNRRGPPIDRMVRAQTF